MSGFSAVLIFSVIGSLYARQADIDINRLRLLPNEARHNFHSSPNSHGRRSILSNQITRDNDYDDRSGGVTESGAPLHLLHPSTSADPKTPFKIHPPRENPKLFYQSDAYLKQNNQNVNNEVAAVYPGREVVYAADEILPMRLRQHNLIPYRGLTMCVRCPHDRTLIAKAGSDRVVLQRPLLTTCSGRKSPRGVRFVHMYGPRFGSLIPKGSHMIVGKIMYKNEMLHLCKMQVHVLVQTCAVPRSLKVHCDDNKCNFSCKDPKLELQGNSSLLCKDDMNWEGNLPVCTILNMKAFINVDLARNWCQPLTPPDHGRISCKDTSVGHSGLAEGSRCWLRCDPTWRWTPRRVSVCRRGSWTNELICQPKNNKLP